MFDIAKEVGLILGKLEYLTEIENSSIDPMNYIPHVFFHLISILLQRNIPDLIVGRITKLISFIGKKFINNHPVFQDPLLDLLLAPVHTSEYAYLNIVPNFNPSCFVQK